MRALTQCEADEVTGVLRVSGNPGGLFHFRKGVVVAVESPGAPGTEALLLRSGRISEDDWTAALRAGAENLTRGTEFGTCGGVGSAELRVVALMAARDGAFAIAAGSVEGHTVDDETAVDVALPAADGIDPGDLLRETARRLEALGTLPFPLSPYRQCVAPAPGTDPASAGLTTGRRDILRHATGRRTARDIAFAVGRGVYPVTVEISRMLGERILELVSTASTITPLAQIESLRPRHEADLPPPPDTGIYETERKYIGL